MIPISAYKQKSSITYLLVKENENFEITASKYVFLTWKAENEKDIKLSEINLNMLESRFVPNWFTGRIITQNFNTKISNCLSFEKGIKVNGVKEFIGEKIISQEKLDIKNDGNGSREVETYLVCTSYYTYEWGPSNTDITTIAILHIDCVTMGGDNIPNIPSGPVGNQGNGSGSNSSSTSTTPPSPDPCDPSLVSPEETIYNQYVLVSPSLSATINSPNTNSGSDTIIGMAPWTVVQGQIASWQIKANTSYAYYHTLYYLTNGGWEDNYEMYYYSTISTYFTGSNTFITSIWTQTGLTDQVLSNNTKNTMGVSHVIGTIKHTLNTALALPFCGPLALNTTTEVGNFMNFYPK